MQSKNGKILAALLCIVLVISALPALSYKAKAAENGALEVAGDINGDGEINAKDVTMLRRFLAGGWGVTVNKEDADINGDGEVNAKDVTMLRRYLAGGWGVEPPEKYRAVQGDIEINGTSFPDETFREYVRNYDIDGNGQLSEAETNAVVSIDVQNLGISDLSGIEMFANLTWLSAANNNISCLNLSDNVKLEYLCCSNNQLSSLDIRRNPMLKVVDCCINTIRVLDISNNPLIISACDEGDFEKYKDYIISNRSVYRYDYEDGDIQSSLMIDEGTELICDGTSVEIIKELDDQNVNEFENAVFSVLAEGKRLSYQWEYKYSDSDIWNKWNGVNDDELIVYYRASRDSMSIRCSVSDMYGHSVVSDIATLQYIDDPDRDIADFYYTRPDPVDFPEGLSLNEQIAMLPNDEDLEDPVGTNYYYYRQLTPVQKVLYWQLENLINNGETVTINGVSSSISNDNNRAFDAQKADNPLFGSYSGFSYGMDGDTWTISLTDNSMDIITLRDIKINAVKMAEMVGIGLDRETTVKNLISVVCSNVDYDYDAYMHIYFPYLNSAYSAEGFFLNGMCVCDGYAQGIKYLCDMLRIPCIYVAGNLSVDNSIFTGEAGEAHAWNYIMLEDGKWYLLDLSGVTIEEKRNIEGIKEIADRGSKYTPYDLCDSGYFELPTIGETYEYKKDFYVQPEISMDFSDFEEEGHFEYQVNEDGVSCTVTGYNGCQKGDLIIPEKIDGHTVTKIGKLAFYFDTGFTGNIIIPDSVTEIDDYAFLRCSGISGTVHLPLGLKRIGQMAFAFCTNMKGELNFPLGLEEIGICAFNYDDNLSGSLYLPEGLTYLGTGSFSSCSNISGTMLIPDAIEFDPNMIIGTQISSYTISESSEKYSIVDGVLYSKDETLLLACPKSKNGVLLVADGTLEIVDYACQDCNNLTGILFNDGLKKIGVRAFMNCNISGTLILPESLEYIGENSFSNTFASVPDGFIGDLSIPDSVTYVGADAFSGNIFGGRIKLPAGITEILRGTYTYCKFTGDLVIPEGVTKIGEWAFASGNSNDNMFSNKEKLILPRTVTEIGKNAFWYSGLSGDIEVTGVTVEEGAFEGNYFESIIGVE